MSLGLLLATHSLHRRSPAFRFLSWDSANDALGNERTHTQQTCMPAAACTEDASGLCGKLRVGDERCEEGDTGDDGAMMEGLPGCESSSSFGSSSPAPAPSDEATEKLEKRSEKRSPPFESREAEAAEPRACLLYTSPSPRD